MEIEFYKYHGAGNDFVIIDNRRGDFLPRQEKVAFLCDRHYGIGADGLMLLEAHDRLDFTMRYFNSDGREATMCGNGGRCIVAFAKRIGIVEDKAVFMASDGEHSAVIGGDIPEFFVKLKMADVDISSLQENSFFLDTGSPHHVAFVNNIESADVLKEGKKIRYSADYKSVGGVNVNFVSWRNNFLKIRTYERGVEDETLACGTGATAAAIIAGVRQGKNRATIEVEAMGGILEVSYDIIGNFARDVYLAGPAREVFKGRIFITDGK